MKGLAHIKPFEINDKVSGNTIKLSVSPQYSVLSVNNQSYYFLAETGELDGTSTDFMASCEKE